MAAINFPSSPTLNQVYTEAGISWVWNGSVWNIQQATPTEYVPYNGATGNVNLGEYGLSTGYLQFDTTPTTYTPAIGNMGWNEVEGTIELLLRGGVVNLPIGQKQVARIVNGTGTNVLRSNYQVVKVTGAQGQRLQVNLAQANNDANSADTLGLIAENINNNNTGFIITSGLLENIDTTGSLQGETWADGNPLYLSPTVPGRLTNVKPQAPDHTVIVGFVIYAHANNGKIFVKVDNGYEIDELHNVRINTGTLSNGQVLKYNTSLSVWENATDTVGTGTVISVSVVSANGFAGTVATASSTPAITLSTTITGILKGNGTAISAAVANTDYQSPITLTTTGSSGASTFNGTTLNIPTYTLAGLGGFANPMTTLGDVIYGAASGVATRLAGNTTTAKQYLSQTGTGTVSAAPSWSAIAGGDVTGAALTKTDDTNVTLTLGGTPSTALLRAASLTLGWTGTLGVARGGTGASTLTGVLIGNGTSAVTAVAGTASQLLRRNAGNTAYEFFTPTYLTANETITLSGDVSGSGTTSIPVTIGASKVTNAMLVNSSFNIGTTSISLGRASAAQTLTGVSIDGNAATSSALGGYANQTIYTLLSPNGNLNGPVIKARWDSGTVNRYIDIGYIDGNGTYYEGLKFYNGTTLTFLGNTVWHAGNFNPSNYLVSQTSSYTTAGTGWYRIASTSGDGRGTYYVEAYTTGGNHNPSLIRIKAQGDWSSIYILSVETDGNFPASGVRVTRSASNTFLEINFNTTITSGGARVTRFGHDVTVSLNSGSLPGGGDTVHDSVTFVGKGVYTPGGFRTGLNTASGRANLSFDVGKSVLGNIHFMNGAGLSNSANQAAITFQGGLATEAQAGIYVLNDNSNGTSMGFTTTDSYATGPQLFMTATNSGVVNFPRAVPTYAGTSLVYNSGTWGISISGNASTASTASSLTSQVYNISNEWFRDLNDDAQVKFYGNSRTMIYRTDGNTNAHGGGAYAHIFYYGGSADGNRVFIINPDGRLYSPYHGWLDTMSISGNAATASTVTINDSASNDWYDLVWRSGNTLYRSTATANGGVQIYPAGNYIRCQYINTTDDITNSISQFVVKNSDSYHRSATPTLAADTIRGVASGSWGISITGNAATATNASNINSTQPTIGYSISGQNIEYVGQGGPQVLSQGSGAAMMSFHRPGAYAINLGLGTDNQLRTGGWSRGGNYVILDSGNYTSYAMQGAGYSANQNLNTTSGPTFAGITSTANININSNELRIGNTSSYHSIEVGVGRTGDGFAYIDLIGDTTYSDYGLRIMRGNGGANTYSILQHRGSGNFALETVDQAALVFSTWGTARAVVQSDGDFRPAADDLYKCGTPSYRWYEIYSARGTINTSDIRQKEEIAESDLGLKFITELQPVSYKMKNDKSKDSEKIDLSKHYGLIAQQVKEVLGEREFAGYVYDEKYDSYGLRYTEFIAPLIKSVQELKKEVDSLKAEIVRLNSN